jgi:hypothetical protein
MDRQEYITAYDILNDLWGLPQALPTEEVHARFREATDLDFILWTDRDNYTDNVILSILYPGGSDFPPSNGLTAFIYNNDDPNFYFIDFNGTTSQYHHEFLHAPSS